MVRDTDPFGGFQPSLETVELLCERLGEIGYPIGADTARELLRAVFASEAPRLDARLRDALNTALETIRVATQSAIGVLGATAPVTPAPRALLPTEAPQPRVIRETPTAGITRVDPPSDGSRKLEEPLDELPPSTTAQPKRGRDEVDGEGRRPVFRRPRGR